MNGYEESGYVARKPETYHRCRVYRFGVLWHWKCDSTATCGHGGRSRTREGAQEAALAHAKSQPWVSGTGARITYEQALRECDALEYVAEISEEAGRG